MRSPVLAILWENWRLTRLEAAHRLSLGLVGGSAVLVWFAAVAPNEAARDFGATIALSLIIFLNFPLWLSIAKLKGGRFLDGYRPGFPLSLLYTRPIGTAVLVGVPMAYQAALAGTVYLVSAFALRWAFDYPFPLLSVAAPLAAVHLGQAAGDWSTRSKVVQWLGTIAPVAVLGSLAMFRREAWPAPFDFSLADYALMAAIGLASYGVAVAGVARQRRGDARVTRPWTAGSAGFPEWLVTLFRFPCPTSSATRAQVWFDLKSSGWPVLAIGLALAIVIPLLFVVTTQIDVVLSGFSTRPVHTRVVAVVVAMFSLPAVLILGANAFGIRARQGRTYANAFEATQACGTARMAGLKVLVRSVCLLAALVAVGTSVWTSASFIPFDVLDDNDTFIEKARSPVSGWMRAIEGAVGAMSVYQLLALAFVTFIVVAAMVGSRAALAALRARYPRRLNIAGSLLLLHGFVLVLLAMGGQRGFGTETLTGAVFGTTRWVATAAIALATVYLLWRVLAERLLTRRHVCGAALVSAAFAAAWVTVLSAAGVPLSTTPATDAVWALLPALLPLTASVLAPWSLSRIRHT